MIANYWTLAIITIFYLFWCDVRAGNYVITNINLLICLYMFILQTQLKVNRIYGFTRVVKP